MEQLASGLYVDGKSAGTKRKQYEADMASMVRALQRLQSGRALIQAMGRSAGKKTIIRPDPSSTARDPNAYAQQERYGSAVYFTPWIFNEFIKRHRSKLSTVAFHADEIFYHELVHALRQVARVMMDTYLSHSYDDIEEFFAIMVSNIYISEKNDKDDDKTNDSYLRADHYMGRALDDKKRERDAQWIAVDSKDPSLEFLGLDINITGPRGGVKQATKNALLVETLIKQQPEFCREIARAKASFNPIDCLMDEMKEHNVKTAAELVAVWEGPRSAKRRRGPSRPTAPKTTVGRK